VAGSGDRMSETFVTGEQSAAKRWLMLCVAVLTLQAAYWLVLAPLFRFTPLPPEMRVMDAEVATLAEPTLGALSAASFEHVDLPWSGCCEARYYALRHRFDLEAGATRDFGFVSSVGADNFLLYVNGQLVQARGRMAPQASYYANDKHIVRIPHGYLRPGPNRLEIITARNAVPYTDFAPFPLGDYATMERLAGWRIFVMHEFRIAGALVAGLIAIVALALMMQAKNRLFAFWLATLAGSWCLYNLYYNWHDTLLPPAWRMIVYFAVGNALTLSWLCFIDVWTGKAWVWMRRAAIAVFAIIIGVTAWSLLSDFPSGYELSGQLKDISTMIAAALVVTRFAWHMATTREDRAWEAAAFALCVTAVAVDALNEFVWQRAAGHTMNLAPFLLFALIIAIASRNLRLYESMSAFNDMLSQRLSERETEIRERYVQLQALQKAKDVAEERQRIMRDMHDGIGGQIMGLLLESRAERLTPQAMTQGLEASLNDLRLVVDSLDQAQPSLALSLASLHERLRRQTEAAGVELVWRNTIDESVELRPNDVLQVCRIVQEAVTNTLRHAGASRIDISATREREGAIVLAIRDNGRGLPAERKDGRGLANMQRRAAALGAELDLKNDGGLTTVLRFTPAN